MSFVSWCDFESVAKVYQSVREDICAECDLGISLGLDLRCHVPAAQKAMKSFQADFSTDLLRPAEQFAEPKPSACLAVVLQSMGRDEASSHEGAHLAPSIAEQNRSIKDVEINVALGQKLIC